MSQAPIRPELAAPTRDGAFLSALRRLRERAHDEIAHLETELTLTTYHLDRALKDVVSITKERDELRKAFDALAARMKPVEITLAPAAEGAPAEAAS